MKEYKLLKDLPDYETGSIFSHSGDPLDGEWYYKSDRVIHTWLHQLLNRFSSDVDWFEPVQARPDWRERYEKWFKGLNSGAMDLRNPPEDVFDKMLAFMKILCYMEWANEGIGWEEYPYTVEYNKIAKQYYTESYTDNQSIFEFKNSDDIDHMLTIPELVEALNEVFNVK